MLLPCQASVKIAKRLMGNSRKSFIIIKQPHQKCGFHQLFMFEKRETRLLWINKTMKIVLD